METTKNKELQIEGMTCSSCAIRIKKALEKIPEITEAEVSYPNHNAVIHYNKNIQLEKISKIIEDTGYKITTDDDIYQKEINQAKNQLIYSWLITLPLSIKMILEMFFNIFIINKQIAFYIDLVLAIPVIFIFGFPIIKQTYKSFRKLSFGMDSLIGIGAISAYSTGLLKIFLKDFESFVVIGTMIIAINYIGNYIKIKSTGKASQAIKKLLNLQAKKAHLVKNFQNDSKEAQSITDIDANDLEKNDIVLVKPGEKIPSDGIVIKGESSVNESIATGESIPVDKKENSEVIGSTVNIQGAIYVKITKVGEETFLYQIVDMVKQAQSSKVPIQQLADKITAFFVPTILIISILTFILWIIFPEVGQSILETFKPIIPWINTERSSISLALFAAIATLVVACPCALGLATPTALMVGMGVGASKGILIRNGEAIQEMQNIDIILFDKTGTITKGNPKVFEHNLSFEDFQNVTALEYYSEHPIAKALIKEADKNNLKYQNQEIEKFSTITGNGIEGEVNKTKYIIGKEDLMVQNKYDISKFSQEIKKYSDKGYTTIFIAKQIKEEDSKISVIGIIGIADRLKENAKSIIKQLNKNQLVTAMITGDNERAANAIANQVGVKEFHSNLLPNEKIEIVKKYQKQGKKVAMVGDGINDAPSLKQADIGIAIGTGTDIAIESSDITLVSGNINGVLNAFMLSKKTFAKIKQNLFWAFIYNIVAIPLAVLGLLSPIIAETAMAFSSINVVTNSMRLNKESKKLL